MTNATLEPTTIESPALSRAATKVADIAPRPAAPDTGTGRMSLNGLPQRKITQLTSIQGENRGLLSRPFYLLKDDSFQLGLSGPGKLWYKESQVLNAKDKAVLNQALHGYL